MHGATVEDEWCAKQNISLRRVYLSVGVHYRYLSCLSSPPFASQFYFKLVRNNISRLSFCLSFVWSFELKDYIVVFLCIFNASLQPPAVQEQPYCGE